MAEQTPSAVEILQRLIRFKTVNPPGDEAACAIYLRDLLANSGIETRLMEKAPGRPNLVARLAGTGEAPPFLMQGHTDVVGVSDQPWSHPPFGGTEVEGYVWGRGAVDMKSGLAMMASALLTLSSEGTPPRGDIIFAAVVDEETGGDAGARFLVDEHADLFKGVKYAIGEVGGFTVHIQGRRIYPVMIAEKQSCWLRLTFRGPGGHGSLPVRGGAMARASEAVRRIESRRLPVHVTSPARAMIRGIASSLPVHAALPLNLLTVPVLTNRILALMGTMGVIFDAALHNTVTPTVINGGDQSNVVPTSVTLDLDGRILPGFGPDDLVRELRKVVGVGPEIEVLHHNPGPADPDMGLFGTLASVLEEADPGARAVPFMIAGTTDARFFSKLGIQTYGFTPMKLPQGLDFTSLFHGPDERIPLEALRFGADAVHNLLRRL